MEKDIPITEGWKAGKLGGSEALKLGRWESEKVRRWDERPKCKEHSVKKRALIS